MDLSGLIIEGDPSQEELQAAWNEILFEYSTLIKSENSDYVFQLSKEIALLHCHITYVDYCCREGNESDDPHTYIMPGILHFRHDADVINEIISLGYELTAPFASEEYFRQLSLITSLCKRKVFDLDEATDEYKRLNNTVTGKKQTEEDFMSTVVMLSKHQGYDIDVEINTVYKFTIIFNNYLAHKKAEAKAYNHAL